MRNRIYISTLLFVGLTFSSCNDKTRSTESKIESPEQVKTETTTRKIEAVNMTSSEFKTLVASQPFVVVDFHATWCRPCKIMAPFLHKIDGEYEDSQFKLVKIDVDKNKSLSSELGIAAMPTLKLYKDGVEVHTRVGGLNESQLRVLFAPYL